MSWGDSRVGGMRDILFYVKWINTGAISVAIFHILLWVVISLQVPSHG